MFAAFIYIYLISEIMIYVLCKYFAIGVYGKLDLIILAMDSIFE